MARDMGCLLALHYVYPQYVAGNWPLTFVWWNASGFMLWALFVIGEKSSHVRGHPKCAAMHVRVSRAHAPWLSHGCTHVRMSYKPKLTR